MRIGKLTSVANGPERDVEVRISAHELYSEISDPPGAIPERDITRCDVVEESTASGPLVHLYVTVGGRKVRFYTGETQLDIVLLLDELEASFGNFSRTWEKAEQAPGA